MKQFKHKKTLGLLGLGLGIVLLSSCTANFCSPVDQAAMAYPYDQGATVYVSKAEYEALKEDEATKALIETEEALSVQAAAHGIPTLAGPAFGASVNDKVYKYIPYTGTGDSLTLTANKTKGFLADFLTNAKANGYSLPGIFYYAAIDDYVLKAATVEYFKNDGTATYTYKAPETDAEDPYNDTFLWTYADKLAEVVAGSELTDESKDYVAVNPYREYDPSSSATEIPTSNSILRSRGTVKFTGSSGTFLGNMAQWNELIRAKAATSGFDRLTAYDVPGIDYENYYKNQITSKVSSYRSCIATKDGEFGHYGTFADWRVSITQKDWGYAWSKGFLEGLLVYPVTWLLDTLAYSFDSNLTGMGQIWALVIVTLIVRGILLAVSFRSTMDNQKMQALQPEITKLQQKYPNAQTNQAEKQRLSQEQMMLYRRHGIKPFRQFLIMIVQFPVFICVWAGLQGSAALSTGEILGMRLSDNINAILFDVSGTWYLNTHGWWTALVLFLLMAGTQIFAMMLPRILAKRKAATVSKTVKAQENNTMKWVSYGLIVFTIIMGFFLPSAMGVYWLIGGIISAIQTLITQYIMGKSKKGK